MFSERILLTPAVFKENPSLLAHRASPPQPLLGEGEALRDDPNNGAAAEETKGFSEEKNFSAFFLGFVDVAVQFCFRCKFSFHEKPFKSSLTVTCFS